VDKHLYITDLDGTLLKGDKTLSAYSRKQLQFLLKERNVRFTIATARSYTYAKQVLEGIDIRLPVILKKRCRYQRFFFGQAPCH